MNKSEKGFCLSAIAMVIFLILHNIALLVIGTLVFCYYTYKILRG